jgi:hypothetical protein
MSEGSEGNQGGGGGDVAPFHIHGQPLRASGWDGCVRHS